MPFFKNIFNAYRVANDGVPDPSVAMPDGSNQAPLCDAQGRVWSREFDDSPQTINTNSFTNATWYKTTPPLSNLYQVTSGPSAMLYALFWHTFNNTRYVQFFDSAIAPVAGAIPVISVPVKNDEYRIIDILDFGISFPNGIWVGVSTNNATFTPAPVALLWANILTYT